MTSASALEKSTDTARANESARIFRERALLSASAASEQRLLGAEAAKGRIGATARSNKSRAAAVVAVISGGVSGVKSADLVFKHPNLFFKLFILRAKLHILRLKITVRSFKFRVLRLDEPKVLTNDRRRSVLVDQLFKRLEQSHRDSPF